jgi:hypothetical protein
LTRDRLPVRPPGITSLIDGFPMVGNRPLCQGCGAPIGKDYEYCNVCGRRTSGTTGGKSTVSVNPPRVIPVRVPEGKLRRTKESTVPRRELVIALLAMTCMAPFCTWLSSFGGLVGVSAAFNEAFYGRYIMLLAASGLLLLMAGDILPAAIPRKAIVAGMGAGTVALTALDYMEIVRYNLGPESYLMQAMPGMGMYLALALGIAIPLAVLVPARRKPAVADRPILRPGSRGSDPSARR